MKGVIFTEFFAFVEENHSIEFLQETIDQTDLASKGVYTATGTYPFCEMGALLTTVVERTGKDAFELLKLFGGHLFKHFSKTSSHFFEGIDNAFDFLNTVESHIHVDVRKLYPDAELPSFDTLVHTPDRFVMKYESSRGLGALCEGLIRGCLDHFGETAEIKSKLISSDPVTQIEFTLQK